MRTKEEIKAEIKRRYKRSRALLTTTNSMTRRRKLHGPSSRKIMKAWIKDANRAIDHHMKRIDELEAL